MQETSEFEAMKVIDDTLSKITDKDMKDRILRWAWAKFSSHPKPTSYHEADGEETGRKKRRVKGKKTSKAKVSHTIVKELNLKPSGKPTFGEFVAEKRPSSKRKRCVVCVYYLQRVLEITPTNSDYVFTCFKSMGWRVPADLDNTLQWVASQKGWLDTSNMTDIKLTTHGENLIEHDLPRKQVRG